MAKMAHTFIAHHPEKEPFSVKQCAADLIDEYIENDAERANTNFGTVIYDSIDISPHYDGTPGDTYIDEKDLIELPIPYQQ